MARPVTSVGWRSGVHWIRAKLVSAMVCAIERARIVFAVPRTSSSSTWPPLARAARTGAISSCLPRTTRSMFSISRSATDCAARRLLESWAIRCASAIAGAKGTPSRLGFSAARHAQRGQPARLARYELCRPRAEIDRAYGGRGKAREHEAAALPEADRLPANGGGKHHHEVALRIGPARGGRLDDVARGGDADDGAFVDRADVRVRRRDRVARAGAELDVERGALVALELHRGAEVAAVGRRAEGDADVDRHRILVALVGGVEVRGVVAVRVRRPGERPEVAVVRPADDDGALNGFARGVRDRAVEAVRVQPDRGRGRSGRVRDVTRHAPRAVALHLRVEIAEPVADVEGAVRGRDCSLLRRRELPAV